MEDKADAIRTRIRNIDRNTDTTEEEKLQLKADLMNDSEFKSLESAMNGATRCFTSTNNDLFERASIFDAAYSRACENVMFSREAIAISMPYITRQLAIYVAAYNTMSQVYDAYEEVYGANTILETREIMYNRLSGLDLNGQVVCKSVNDLVDEYVSRDKYIFVNGGKANIRLSPKVVGMSVVEDKEYNSHPAIESKMKVEPLSLDQIQKLSNYAAARKMSLFDYLFNEMEFTPVDIAGPIIGVNTPGIESPFLMENGRWTTKNNSNKAYFHIYMFSGPQSFKLKRSDRYRPYYAYADVIDVSETGAKTEKELKIFKQIDKKWAYHRYDKAVLLCLQAG